MNLFQIGELLWKVLRLWATRKGPLEVIDCRSTKQPRGPYTYLIRLHVKNWGRERDYSVSCKRLGDYPADPFELAWEDAKVSVTLQRRQESYINVAFAEVIGGEQLVSPIRPGWADPPTDTIYRTYTPRAMASGRLTLDLEIRPQRKRSRLVGIEITSEDGRTGCALITPCVKP